VYEEKIDGHRMLAYKDGRTVRLERRKGVDHTRRFSELAAAVAAPPGRALVLDGEVAIFDRQFRSRFGGLGDPDHPRVGRSRPPRGSGNAAPLLMGLRSALSLRPRSDQAISA
jgi:hypothetical protein